MPSVRFIPSATEVSALLHTWVHSWYKYLSLKSFGSGVFKLQAEGFVTALASQDERDNQ